MHVIRLRSAWTPLEGGARHTRRFHRPTGLDGSQRVWLCVGPAERAELNGEPLVLERGRGDITRRLDESNLLSVDTPARAEPAGVQLEIEEQ